MCIRDRQLAAQKNLSYVLAEKLAQRILKGEYEPGTLLPGEIELGAQFGVSRTAAVSYTHLRYSYGRRLPGLRSRASRYR